MPGLLARAGERAAGLAVAAGLIVRHAGPSFPAVGIEARLAMLPARAVPVEAPVRVSWNAHMVPFIEAADRRDLAVALGAVHMHLRCGQIEVLRRIAEGRVAEMAGPAAIGIDRSIRMLDIASVVPRMIAALAPATRDWAEAFLAGMNAVLAAGPAPPELAPLGIAPEPWTLSELFTLARLFSADLAWPVQRRLLALRDRTAPEAWAALWPRLAGADRPDAPPTDPASRALGLGVRAGSNAAAVDGARTATGRPILGGDPHLGLTLPNPWLAACLHGGGISALGLMLPGVPFLALGRNRDIAWGGTSLHAASSDFVDLRGVPPGRIERRTEVIRVRGGRPRRVVIRRSPHGPVVSDGELFRTRAGAPIALRWMGHEPSDELGAMLGVMEARDRAGFAASLAAFGLPGQTMVYAGPDGIGRQVAAHLPRRPPGTPADLVLPPDAVERAWSERADGAALFDEWDPPDGFVASANERLVGRAPERTPLGVFFAPESRVERLRALLAPEPGAGAGGAFDADAMERLFLDRAQPNARGLRDLLLAHAPARPRPADAGLLRALAGWDFEYGRDSAGALAFELLLASVADRVVGRRGLDALVAVWTWRRLLAARLAGEAPETLARAVASGLPEAARRFRRLRRWGDAHRHRLRHVLGAVPLVGARFDVARFPGEGGNETLNKTGHGLVRGRHRIGFGATARYVFDLADPDGSRIVLFGGQDGYPNSACAMDQVALWRRGASMRLPLDPAAARRDFPHVTVLGAPPPP